MKQIFPLYLFHLLLLPLISEHRLSDRLSELSRGPATADTRILILPSKWIFSIAIIDNIH